MTLNLKLKSLKKYEKTDLPRSSFIKGDTSG